MHAEANLQQRGKDGLRTSKTAISSLVLGKATGSMRACALSSSPRTGSLPEC